MQSKKNIVIQSNRPGWADWVVFLLLTLVIAASNWPAISANNVELGDFAANSLLIQDAKSFKLLYGNYSRVGFNHPGPAFLYVLAAGEALFHDLMHVVPSALSGQLLAVATLSAAWLTGLMRVMRRSLQSTSGALLFVGVFALAMALFDHDILAGLWFPHLYVLPFALLVASAATLVQGRTDSMLALGISTGFLLNGHVSFVAIVAIILAVVLFANWISSRNDSASCFLRSQFLRANARATLMYVAIVLAFLVPFLLANIIDSPSPVKQYLAFSKGTKGNTLGQAAQYVLSYWKGTAGWTALLALVVVIMARKRLASTAREVVAGLLIAMAGASLSLLYYAKVGIDLLEFSYIGLFYVTVPGFALALAAWYGFALIPAMRHNSKIGAFLAVVALGFCYTKIHQAPDYAPQFNEPRIVPLLQAVSALHPERRIVLDVDNGANWGNNWVAVLGMQAYAKRRHADPFCVNANWHISFTKSAHCTPSELAAAPRYFVHESSSAPSTLGKPAIDQMNVAFFPMQRPEPIGFGPMSVKSYPQAFSGYFLQHGWSTVEGEFVWSLGQESHMVFAVPNGFKGVLTIDATSFLPRPDYVQEVQVLTNGRIASTVRFNGADNRKQFTVPLAAIGSGIVTVTLKYPNAISPQRAGLSSDQRVLALGLFGIELKRN